jgi:hypothetical protein
MKTPLAQLIFLYLRKMKYLAFIFSIYCILLAVLPCQDSEDLSSGREFTTIQKSQVHHGSAKQESCPPFCTCTCCSNARQLASRPALYIFTKAIAFAYPGYPIHATRKQTIAVWQPPQTS